ncbi:hypothetical protein [Chryseobacterium sp. MMS23-Vi53]|uniref:hypothetical protein n=1 Tax=Chryseobacterium sp. MMS23-Vi53 TaxID=3386644 RepID=UPI0039E875C8
MINTLIITPYNILFAALAVMVLYVFAISILFKNKSGILSYLALIIFPIFGPLGIIFGNYCKK